VASAPSFRAPLFLAVVAIAIWRPFFTGEIEIPTAFSPVDWHIHETIYSYEAAVVAGFPLTAIPSCAGCLPVAGWLLVLLATLWAIGWVAVFSAKIGWIPATLLDPAFLLIFGAVAAHEVIAGKNQRNVKVFALILVLVIANAGFHIEAMMTGAASISARAGLAVMRLASKMYALINNKAALRACYRDKTPAGDFRRLSDLAHATGGRSLDTATS
jgi:uncharacterized protein involved in response to NO